ncbi:hypothetical protein Dimus_028125 [Dionaea muscipula]
MASPGEWASSGSSTLQQIISSPNQEEELQAKMDERKRKRMESNRESAKRSRMRKQQQLDGLMAQVAHLKKENSDIAIKVNLAIQNYLKIESENCVLRAQIAELSTRFQSLDGLITSVLDLDVTNNHRSGGGIEGNFPVSEYTAAPSAGGAVDNCLMISPWSSAASYLNQPIMASADMLQY